MKKWTKIMVVVYAVVIIGGMSSLWYLESQKPEYPYKGMYDTLEVFTLPHLIPISSTVIDVSNWTLYEPLYFDNGTFAGYLLNKSTFVLAKDSPGDYHFRFLNPGGLE